MILNFWTDRSGQTVQTKIRLMDQGLHCLPLCLHYLDSYTPGIYAERYIVFVFLFVRPSCWCNLPQSFTLKFLKWGISHQPLIRKHSFWTMDTLKGLLPCHKFWPQGSCPGVGLEVKIWDTLKSIAFSLMRIPSNNIMSEFRHPNDLGFCVMR